MTAREIADALGARKNGCGWTARCPVPDHEDKHASFSINEGDRGKVLVKCHSRCGQAAIIEALRARGLWPAQRNGSKSHMVKDACGVVVALHERKGIWRHPDGRPSEHGEIKPKLLPLFGVEHLPALDDGHAVLVAEGEKATDALMARDVVAVGTYGTSAMPCDDSLQPLLRFRVKLWADNDTKGAEHMAEIACALHRLGHRDVHLVTWAGAPDRGDAADYAGTDDELHQLLNDAKRVEPPEVDTPGLYDPAVTVRLSDVAREEVSWLWPRRIPRGRLTALLGDPGVGKSWLTLAIVKAVTTGEPLPGEAECSEPGRALILTAEDGLADTVRPRLEDMGADLTAVTVLTAVRDVDGKERFPDLSRDLLAIDFELKKGGYSIVIIDPLNAFLGGVVDTHRDASLRSVLGPLAQLAETHGVAVVFVLHLNKSKKERAIYRASGGIGYIAAARVALLAGANPEDPDDRALVWLKGNLTEPAEAVGYEVRDGLFHWCEESSLTPQTILAPDPSQGRSSLKDAKVFLLDALADGPAHSVDVTNDAEVDGITERTLRRARKELGVQAIPVRLAGETGIRAWKWALPGTKAAKVPEEDPLAALPPSVPKQVSGPLYIGRLNKEDKAAKDATSENPAPLAESVPEIEEGPGLDGQAAESHIAMDVAVPMLCTRCGAGLSVLNKSGLCGRCVGRKATS